MPANVMNVAPVQQLPEHFGSTDAPAKYTIYLQKNICKTATVEISVNYMYLFTTTTLKVQASLWRSTIDQATVAGFDNVNLETECIRKFPK